MAKVYAITCYRIDKATGKQQEYTANSAVWRKRDSALAECRRHLFNKEGYEPVIQTNTQTGVQTIIGYKWTGKDTEVTYIVNEWPVL